MTEALKTYFKTLASLSDAELELVDRHFEWHALPKKTFLLEAGRRCRHISFILRGCVRHFHVRDGEEITCDISLEGDFLTDFKSFNEGVPAEMNFLTLEKTEVLQIERESLAALYRENGKFETVGRKIAERVALRSMEMAMSLATDKPEQRYRKLLERQPEIFQRVRQRHIAKLLGITPESLSRIRKRIYKRENS